MGRTSLRWAVVVALQLVSGVASAEEPEATPPPWPPAGPAWEVDPPRAFQLARERKTGVLAYVALEDCPECVTVAKAVWSKPAVIAAGRDVVLLAVYRYARRYDAAVTGPRDPAKEWAVPPDSDWAVRLNVLGVPQVRLLDGWGRPLPSASRHRDLRTLAEALAAIADAKVAGRVPERLAAPTFLAALLAHVAAEDRALVASPEPWVRAPAWTRALANGDWPEADLLALWKSEDDPVVRRAILDRVAPDQDRLLARLLDPALSGPNDFVRSAAFAACERVGGDAAVAAVGRTIDAVLTGSSGFENPNNVLCDAAGAARKLPDVRLIAPLSRIIEKNDADNGATLYAVEALVAVGKKHGMARVKEPLKAAKALRGATAGAIAKLVDTALGG